MLDALRKLGPRDVVVFDEIGGAVAANEAGRFSIAEFPDPEPPLDITGAGDAFAATLVAALITGMPLREALRWPPVNAASVSRHFGTQGGLLRLKDLVTRLDAAPEFAVQDR
jgi:sugar/nucleoside kinase (ribokinase family)